MRRSGGSESSNKRFDTMIPRSLLFALSTLFGAAALAAEQVNVNYQYEGGHRADFSNVRGGLRLGGFSDERGLADGSLIVDGHRAEAEMAELLRDAFAQGFAHGGAKLGESEADHTVSGSLTAIETAQTADGIELTMRATLRLNRGDRTIWQTNLFGRGTADDITTATQAALTRLIRELMNDDYFLMELR